MNRIWLLLVPFLLAAASPKNFVSDISSDEAAYNGSQLILEGHVKLDHHLGEMRADSAILDRTEGAFPFSKAHLKRKVLLSFHDQATLACDEAELDFIRFYGTVSSLFRPAVYQKFIDRSKEWFELESNRIQFEFDDAYEINVLTALGDVRIRYGEDYLLSSDEACYQGHEITAFSREPEIFCSLKHDQDEVKAKKMVVNLAESTLMMTYPSGRIASFSPDHLQERTPEKFCHFSSKNLKWDKKINRLILNENIVINDEAFGFLEGEGMIILTQKEQFGKMVLHTIEAKGKTTLYSPNSQSHALTSFGSLKLDCSQFLLTAISPEASLDKQLIYQKDDLTLRADQGSLEYSLIPLGLEPSSLFLSGRVRLVSNSPSRLLRYGLADRVHYNFLSAEIRMLADPGRRVLFWDEKQKLELSAPEIVISIDPQTKEESIKGIGAVRFSFNETEQTTFNEFFKKGSP